MALSFEEDCRRIRASAKLRRQGWERGELWWLLDSLQYRLYRQFWDSPQTRGTVVWDIARRVGKTFALLVIAMEVALRGGGRSVKYAAKTQLDVVKMIRPSISKILASAPDDLRPRNLSAKEGAGLAFRRKGREDSVIDIAGCDDQRYENLRGQEAHLWVADEGGFIAELKKVVDEVLWPQTWTTKGRGIIASSPPDTTGHPFQAYYLGAKARGLSARATFWETPRFTDAEKWEIVRDGAAQKRMSVEQFQQTTVYRREFMAEFVTEETRAVLPHLSESLAERLVRPETETPLFTDWYTVVDLGGSRDPTAILTGYWDFRRKKERYQQNATLLRPTTEQIATSVREMEKRTFSQSAELRGKHFRIMDDDLGIVRRDLATKYNLSTIPPMKDDKQAALMDYQDSMLREEVELSPDCAETMAQCQAAIWNKQHTEYERVDGFGHFDLLDCGLYMHRNVVKNKGRVPDLYGVDLANTRVRRPVPEVSQPTAALRAMLGGS